MSNKSNAVTITQPFDEIDDVAVFSVNAGVPVPEALSRAADLMLYVENLAAADAFINKQLESAIIQTLSEMAKALTKACQGADA